MSAPPRLHVNKQTMSLSLDSSLIQSCMRLDDPIDLVLDYTRTMMGCLLFNPSPQTILMVGLGGGSMVKYLHQHLPEADFTVVEINQSVIDLRDAFHVPPDDARFRVVCADGAAFIAQPPQRYDLVLLDGFNGEGLPDALCSRAFYQLARQALTEAGLLVANVQADTRQCRDIGRRLHKAFSGLVIMVESDEGGNEIMTATNNAALFTRCEAEFEARWQALPAVHQKTLEVSSNRWKRSLLKSLSHAACP